MLSVRDDIGNSTYLALAELGATEKIMKLHAIADDLMLTLILVPVFTGVNDIDNDIKRNVLI